MSPTPRSPPSRPERSSRHFPYAILPPAVLYAKKHPKNASYHDKAMLELALRIGDLLATEDEKGTFEPRLDSDWDNYAWMEAYRLLKPQLGADRDARWKKAIMRNIALFEEDAKARLDFPWYKLALHRHLAQPLLPPGPPTSWWAARSSAARTGTTSAPAS